MEELDPRSEDPSVMVHHVERCSASLMRRIATEHKAVGQAAGEPSVREQILERLEHLRPH